MASDLLRDLEKVDVDERSRQRLGVAGPLRLHRVWPRDADHLLLEYRDRANRLFPAQWRSDAAVLQKTLDEIQQHLRAADATTKSTVVRAGRHSILIQPGGEDRKLKSLRSLIEDGGELLSHRPERRAVARNGRGHESFLKVTSPSTASSLVRAAEHLHRHARGFVIPELLSADERHGITEWSAMRGASVFDFSINDFVLNATQVGRTLRALHEVVQPQWLAAHTGSAESNVLEKWISHLRNFWPERAAGLEEAARDCICTLRNLPETSAVIHRDFFDKQLILTPEGAIAILDFDTLASGDPALDVANYLAHVRLRAIQRGWSCEMTRAAMNAFLPGYGEITGPDVERRLDAYLRAAAIRLVCVYAFRPKWREVITLDRLQPSDISLAGK